MRPLVHVSRLLCVRPGLPIPVRFWIQSLREFLAAFGGLPALTSRQSKMCLDDVWVQVSSVVGAEFELGTPLPIQRAKVSRYSRLKGSKDLSTRTWTPALKLDG